MTILLQRRRFKKALMPILFAAAFSATLTGCSNLFGSGFTDTLRRDANASSDFYMNKMQQVQDKEDADTYKLLAVRALIEENKLPQAQALLTELGELTDAQQLDRTLLNARLTALTGNTAAAQSQLTLLDLKTLSPSQLGRFYHIQSRLAENQHDPIGAVKAAMLEQQQLTDIQRKQQNIDRTWALLRHANTGVINHATDEGNAALGGWLALIKAYHANLKQPTQLSLALQQWKATYPTHPASTLFPKELQDLLNFRQTDIAQLGVLLPLSGDGQILGDTIRHGFNDAKGDAAMPVQFFDTVSTPISDIVAQAKEMGIKTLVGPLVKSNLDQLLANTAQLQGVDVLALNSTPNARAVHQLCYYGLAPEDEAESAAEKMWQDGVRSPLVAVPQNDLGQRVGNAFNVRWQKLAGKDANVRYYHLAADISYFTQETPNAALYVVASPDELAEMKGYLDNNQTPVNIYASSRSHAASNTAEFRALMNGVKFSDIPFFKQTDSGQYQNVADATGGEYQLMRLYAMGADAWLLINHFNELRQVPGYSVSGLTGQLSAGANCNIERQMAWFEYQNGDIIPVN